MASQSYYRIPDKKDNNFCLNDRPLTVNCAGIINTNTPFFTKIPRGRQDFYLLYCVEGNLLFWENQREHRIGPGQLFLLPPKTPYVCTNEEKPVVYYWTHFTGSDAEALLERFDLPRKTVIPIDSEEKIPRLFRALFWEFLLRDRCFDDACAACLTSLLAELSRAKNQGPEKKDSSADTIFQSLSYFHRHISEPITVTTLASIEHFSTSRYRTVFHRCMGMPPSEYMTKMRMQRACELLATSELSVREVADACGYPDQLYFSRVFRANFGISPSKYREEQIFPE